MNAKDTVINKKPSDLIVCPNCHSEFVILYQRMREEQAEISFKAGYKEALEGAVIEGGYESVKKVGIREVVEWVDNLIIGIDNCEFEERLDGDKGCIVLDINENQWQAQLEKWGYRR